MIDWLQLVGTDCTAHCSLVCETTLDFAASDVAVAVSASVHDDLADLVAVGSGSDMFASLGAALPALIVMTSVLAQLRSCSHLCVWASAVEEEPQYLSAMFYLLHQRAFEPKKTARPPAEPVVPLSAASIESFEGLEDMDSDPLSTSEKSLE